MSDPAGQPEPTLGLEGFDALYRGDFTTANRAAQAPTDTGEGFDLDRVPWDLGGPQPVLRELEAAGHIRSEVLDIGCGLGENTVFLAERGYRVCGLDGAPAAIERARNRAEARGQQQTVEFAVAEATTLTGYDHRFATVVDSALYHCLTEPDRSTYLAALHRACQPGARLHLVCFCDAFPEDFPGPYRISETNLRSTLPASGWTIQRLDRTTYATAFTRHDLAHQAPHNLLEALQAANIGYDSHDRLLAPAWLATAERRATTATDPS